MGKSNLLLRITKMIDATGPLSIAEYMHLCLFDEECGYYANSHPIGSSGDFVTAPEVSQLFGEIIGIWCISQWHRLGQPQKIQIAEFGPGRGTLMCDILRAIDNFSEMKNAVSIALIETSKPLINQQKEMLGKTDTNATWCASINELQPLPTLIIANELLDCMPFRQFVKRENVWLENCVSINQKREFCFSISQTQIEQSALPANHGDEPENSVFEFAPARTALAQQMGEHIARHSGAGLLIDYGHEFSGFGDTFQALKNHAFASPLDSPGECDLTSHVDFEAISKTLEATGIHLSTPQTQSQFLLENGIMERAGQLGAGNSQSLQQQITRDVERLIGEDQMGELFKVLQFSSTL